VAERTLHLQGIGRVAAVEAQDLKPGMILSWNYAPAKYMVLSVRSISAHYVELTEANRVTGEVSRRRLKKTSLIGASWPRKSEGDRRRRKNKHTRSSRDRGRSSRGTGRFRVVQREPGSGWWEHVGPSFGSRREAARYAAERRQHRRSRGGVRVFYKIVEERA
jgi:hypothetical protein